MSERDLSLFFVALRALGGDRPCRSSYRSELRQLFHSETYFRDIAGAHAKSP
jgi:hypothetical protein